MEKNKGPVRLQDGRLTSTCSLCRLLRSRGLTVNQHGRQRYRQNGVNHPFHYWLLRISVRRAKGRYIPQTKCMCVSLIRVVERRLIYGEVCI